MSARHGEVRSSIHDHRQKACRRLAGIEDPSGRWAIESRADATVEWPEALWVRAG